MVEQIVLSKDDVVIYVKDVCNHWEVEKHIPGEKVYTLVFAASIFAIEAFLVMLKHEGYKIEGEREPTCGDKSGWRCSQHS